MTRNARAPKVVLRNAVARRATSCQAPSRRSVSTVGPGPMSQTSSASTGRARPRTSRREVFKTLREERAAFRRELVHHTLHQDLDVVVWTGGRFRAVRDDAA